MAISSKVYTTDGSSTIYSSDFKVLSENHIEAILGSSVVSQSNYDLINNAVVFNTAPESGQTLTIRVGTTPDDLLTATTNTDIVAANISDINTIEDNIDDINTVSDNISSVNTNADNIDNINIVGDIGSTGLQGIVDNVTNISTVASIYPQVQDVAAISDAVSTVSANTTSVVNVGTDIDNVNAVAGSTTNIETVATNIADVNAVATNIVDIQNAEENAALASSSATSAVTSATTATTQAGIATTKASEASTSASNASTSESNAATSASNASTSETNAASSASSASTSASNASTSETNAANSATSASTSATSAATSLATFQGQYTSSTVEPSNPDAGDLWFDTTNDIMKVYAGTGFVNAGSSVNGTSSRNTYTATSGQTTFNSIYDVGYVDVYLNGLKLQPTTDFTATDGANVVLTSGANAGDIVDIVAYGTFELADVYTKAEIDAKDSAKADIATTLAGYGITDSYTKTEVNNKPTGFKNYIINGGFDVWQRGENITGGAGFLYVADRWQGYGYATNSYTMSKQSDTTFPTFARVASTNNNIWFTQRLERPRRFRGKTLTYSFWAKSEDGVQFSKIETRVWENGTNIWVGDDASFNHTLTPTWTKYTYTMDVPEWTMVTEAGTDYLKVTLLTTGTGTMDITNVQLEEGSVATPFEQRPYGLELSLCKRYYQRFDNEGLEIYASGTYLSNNHRMTITLPEEMRTRPSITHNMAYSVLSVTSTSKAISFYSSVAYRMDGTGKYIIADAEL